jgi:hypothetical protein
MQNLSAADKHRKLRHATRQFRRVVITGAFVGVLFCVVLSTWLFVANRMPSLEAFAQLRNAVAAGLLIFFAAIPILRFRNSAGEIFPAGALAVAMLSLCYYAWTIYFQGLADRKSPIQILVLGLVCYGLAAVVMWVFGLCRSARHHHHHVAIEAASRRRS